jgi:imidazolonepropionase-like amidohydrolase
MAMDTLIQAGLLIDGESDQPCEGPDATLLVREGCIVALGREAIQQASGEAAHVDLRPLTVMPGLIDAHVHLIGSPEPGAFRNLGNETDEWLLLRAVSNARVALASGLTTVRDCGGRGTLIISLAEAIRAGLLPGPRIVSCGAPITTTAGHCYYIGIEAEGTDAVRRAVRQMHKAGADFIKVMVTGGGVTPGSNSRASQYSLEELQAITDDAHRLGHAVAGHVHGTEGIVRAVRAGFDTLEHCSWLERDGSGRDYDAETVEMMLRQSTFVCRTIAGFERVPLEQATSANPLWKDYEVFRNMVKAGVKIAAGTDSGIDHTPFTGYVTTLETMAGLGEMSNAAIVASATRVAAEAIGLAHVIGTLTPGKYADLIAVQGNPLEDLRALRHPAVVMREGRVVARDGVLAA